MKQFTVLFSLCAISCGTQQQSSNPKAFGESSSSPHFVVTASLEEGAVQKLFICQNDKPAVDTKEEGYLVSTGRGKPRYYEADGTVANEAVTRGTAGSFFTPLGKLRIGRIDRESCTLQMTKKGPCFALIGKEPGINHLTEDRGFYIASIPPTLRRILGTQKTYGGIWIDRNHIKTIENLVLQQVARDVYVTNRIVTTATEACSLEGNLY